MEIGREGWLAESWHSLQILTSSHSVNVFRSNDPCLDCCPFSLHALTTTLSWDLAHLRPVLGAFGRQCHPLEWASLVRVGASEVFQAVWAILTVWKKVACYLKTQEAVVQHYRHDSTLTRMSPNSSKFVVLGCQDAACRLAEVDCAQ